MDFVIFTFLSTFVTRHFSSSTPLSSLLNCKILLCSQNLLIIGLQIVLFGYAPFISSFALLLNIVIERVVFASVSLMQQGSQQLRELYRDKNKWGFQKSVCEINHLNQTDDYCCCVLLVLQHIMWYTTLESLRACWEGNQKKKKGRESWQLIERVAGKQYVQLQDEDGHWCVADFHRYQSERWPWSTRDVMQSSNISGIDLNDLNPNP